MEKVTKRMIIGDVIMRYPEAVKVMFGSGLHCIGCPAASSESIEDGCLAHGMTPSKIDEMILKINKEINKGKDK